MRRARVLAVVLAVTLLVAGCGSSKKSTAGGAASADNCIEQNATLERQDFITNSKFDVVCVKATSGTPFFFINNDDATHTVTTDANAPEAFDAELPKKTSTYSHTFTKKGTYHITCKRHSEKMTLVVT